MRISTAVVALLVSIAPASARSIFGNDKQQEIGISGDDLKIPGDSPLELCPKEHDDDIIKIQSVDLLPNPPLAGEELMIKATGTVKETIEDGAYVNIQIKYGLIRLINQRADLCEQVENVDMSCPIEKGVISLTKVVKLPNEIPPGKYTVFADVYSKDEVPITCLTATVVFGIHKGLGNYFNVEL